MSRWWPETFCVACTAGDRPRGESAARAFAQRLDLLQARRGSRVVVWVGQDVARLLALPWSSRIVTQASIDAYARNGFVETFGLQAQGWRIGTAAPRPGRPLLACGMERETVDALGAAIAERGLRVGGIRSTVVEGFGLHRGRLRASAAGWLAVEEAGWTTLVRVERGVPATWRQLGRGGQTLKVLLERECRLVGRELTFDTLWRLDGPGQAGGDDGDSDALRQLGWTVQRLPALRDDVDARQPMQAAA